MTSQPEPAKSELSVTFSREELERIYWAAYALSGSAAKREDEDLWINIGMIAKEALEGA